MLSVQLWGHVGPNKGKGSLELLERQSKRTRNAIQGLVSGFAACLSLTAPAAAVLTENAAATSIKMPMGQLSGNPGVSSRYVMHYRVRVLHSTATCPYSSRMRPELPVLSASIRRGSCFRNLRESFAAAIWSVRAFCTVQVCRTIFGRPGHWSKLLASL